MSEGQVTDARPRTHMCPRCNAYMHASYEEIHWFRRHLWLVLGLPRIRVTLRWRKR